MVNEDENDMSIITNVNSLLHDAPPAQNFPSHTLLLHCMVDSSHNRAWSKTILNGWFQKQNKTILYD